MLRGASTLLPEASLPCPSCQGIHTAHAGRARSGPVGSNPYLNFTPCHCPPWPLPFPPLEEVLLLLQAPNKGTNFQMFT